MEIGTVYTVQPEPPDPRRTLWFPAGPLRFGVESRAVDPASLAASYADDPEGWAEVQAASPEGGFTDEGVSLHVVEARSGHEYLRFDAFTAEPHYHYIRSDRAHNEVVPYDPVADGPALDWALGRLRTRLEPMLRRAGADAVADDVLAAGGELAAAIEEVDAAARRLDTGAPS